MADQLNIILVPHTHWDREWYQTFQQFRMRLVHTVDKLLDILDRDDAFTHFMLDGQTIVLDDYLEVEPQQEERLRHYIQAGRIQVGPWYVQPDEFLVSGESLIRNLQIGLRRASDFGEPMCIGYVPDIFGHIAQLPQILQGFGIDNAFLWRGVGSEVKKSEFYWAAPDGTKVLVLHLSDPRGYSNARQMPLVPAEFAARTEMLAAQILPKATTNTLLFMNGSDHLEPQDGLPAAIAAANSLLAHINPEHEKLLAQMAHTPLNGKQTHYNGMQVHIGTLAEYVDTIKQHIYQHHGNGNGSGDQVSDGDSISLQVLSGELRSSQFAHLLPGVLSTRMWIKQQNSATEHLLERFVEPLTAWAEQLGASYPEGLVKLAWKYLLQDHPHDSICGCSLDQVHRENAVRFAQSQQVAEGVISQAMQHIAESVNTAPPFATPHTPYKPIAVVVFNPAPGPRSALVQATVQFPGSLQNAAIVDEQGQQMPYTVVHRWTQEIGSMPISREMVAAGVAMAGATEPGQLIHMAEDMLGSILGQPDQSFAITRMHVDTEQQPGVAQLEIMIAQRDQSTINEQELLAGEQQMLSILQREDIHTLDAKVIDQARETLEFVASGLPSNGLKTFWVYPRGLHDNEEQQPAAVRTRSAAKNRIENEWYRVEANVDDGTLTVTDKQTGAVFSGLHRFVDGGDVGDLYTYCPPERDTLVSSPLEPPHIEQFNTDAGCAMMRVHGSWSLPSACTADRKERSSTTTACQITSEIQLVPGVRRIDIHTRVDNQARDHRLRVIFPVSYTVEHVAAEGTFEVRTRPLGDLPSAEDSRDWLEQPVNTFPQKRFVDISNGEIGLGILNRGLPECEVLQNVPGIAPGQMAVAVTLLRGVEWLSRSDLATRRGHAGPPEFTPEAQCLGQHEFDFALVPHKGTWETDDALVLREAQEFNTPVRSLVVPARTSVAAQHLAPTASLVDFTPSSLVVSAIKRSNDGKGLIVRVYNPLSREIEATIRPGIASTRAFVANLQEEKQTQLSWQGEQGQPLHVSIRAGGIMTVLFL
jgi:mannosylglycerate hydrolase